MHKLTCSGAQHRPQLAQSGRRAAAACGRVSRHVEDRVGRRPGDGPGGDAALCGEGSHFISC